jgi:hypothetical protein
MVQTFSNMPPLKAERARYAKSYSTKRESLCWGCVVFIWQCDGVLQYGISGRVSVAFVSKYKLTLVSSHDDMKELYCMSYTSKGTSEILVAGLQDQMFVINVDKGTISRQVFTCPVPT